MVKVLLGFIFFLYSICTAAQLDLTLTQSASECSSDGVITAIANGGTEPYQYRIVSGPEIRGFQTADVFNALRPGSYVVEVRDASSVSETENIVVDGDYVLPTLSVSFTQPTCAGGTDGQAVLTGQNGSEIGTAAFPTYKFRIVDLSTTPQTIIQEQNTDTFAGLSEGTYSFQLEDGCQNTISETITLAAPNTNALAGEISFIEKAACNTFEAQYASNGFGTFPHDVTVTDNATGVVVFTGSLPDGNSSIGVNYDFNTNYTAAIVDACGQAEIIDFSFTATIGLLKRKASDCSGDTTFFFYPSLNSASLEENSIITPATLTLTNQADPSDVLTYNIPDNDNLRVAVEQSDIVDGAVYDVTIVDSCNATLDDTFTLTPLTRATFTANAINNRECLDGTTSIAFKIFNGSGELIRITLNSGPSSFTSEAGVVTDYVYPRVFERPGSFDLYPTGFPPGAYTGDISDGCETGPISFEVFDSQTAQHDFTLDYAEGCGNSNSLIINPNVIKALSTSLYTHVTVTNSDTAEIIFREPLSFFTEGTPVNVPNVQAGNYQLNLEFLFNATCASFYRFTCPCEPQTVDINIPVNSNTSLDSIIGYTCIEGSGSLVAEGTDGTAPYQYEIIDSSVPSNIGRTSTDGVFNNTDEGVYTVRVTDSCGNSADGAYEVTAYLPDLVAACDAAGTRVTIMANPVRDATFTWADSSGTIVQQGLSNELVFDPFDPSQSGEYNLKIDAPSLGCSVLDGSITIPNNPCNSSIDVSKLVEAGPSYDSVTDEYTVTYRITADNTGGQSGVYDVSDTFILGAGTSLTNAILVYGNESDGTDGTLISPFSSGDQIISTESIAGLRTESWLIVATFTVDRNLLDRTRNCSNGGGFTNTITATGDTDLSNNSVCAPLVITELNIIKDGIYNDANGDGITNIGDTVTYSFVVNNSGNVPLGNVIVNDPSLGGNVPGPVSGDTNGDGEIGIFETWRYNADYSITQNDINNVQTSNLASVTGMDADGNTATATSTDPTPCTTCRVDPTCTDCTLTELPDILDIELAKTVDRTIVEIGDEVEFTVSATNNGRVSASGIGVTDLLPSVFEYILHTQATGTYDVTNGLWSIPTLAAGQTTQLQIRATVLASGNRVNIAQLTEIEQTDANASNDEVRAEVFIRCIEILKEGAYADENADGRTNIGDVVNYVFTVRNTGNVPLFDIRVTDPLLESDITIPTSGDTDGDNELDVVETWTFNAPYNITQVNIDDGQVHNLATVSGTDSAGNTIMDASTDPTPCITCVTIDSCIDCTLTELPTTVDISLTKMVNSSSARVGDEIDFTITVVNTGRVTATNVDISEILPDGFDYLRHVATLGEYSEIRGLWNISELDAGQVAELRIQVEVVEGSDYLNIVNLVSTDQIDIDQVNDEDRVEVNILPPLCPIEIYNVFTPNDDGANDIFRIDCIETYTDNRLQIFNRWGAKVYEKQQYDNSWDGVSSGQNTYARSEKLPVGTYFYMLDLGDGSNVISGYLYITR